MMTLKVGAVETKNLLIAKVGYTASTFILISHLPLPPNTMMNPTINLSMKPANPDQPNNSMSDAMKNQVAGKVSVESVGAGLTTPFPTSHLTPNFASRGSTISTPSNCIQENGIEPTTHSDRSGGMVVEAVTRGDWAENTQSTKTKDSEFPTLSSIPSLSFQDQDRVRDFSKLNKSDVRELFQHHQLLMPHQLNLLQTVQRKQQLYPQRYRDDYLRHSSILLLSNGWSSAGRYSMCSIPNSLNRSGQCKLHKYCPYCCFLVRQQTLARYVPVYESGIWFFITGSFTGDLTMTGLNSYHELTCYWDAYKSALQELVKIKLVRGVFWTEELAVNSIAPVQVLPHIHALIEADSMDDETTAQLSATVAANLKARIGPDCLIPNLHVKNLNSQRKLLSHVQYQVKPIQVVKAYDFAWARSLHNNRAGAVQLNSQTADLVLGYSSATNDRTKINYAGNLSPKTKVYIGTKDKEIKQANEAVSEVIKAGTDYIELEENEGPEIDETTISE